jgi:PKD repeat protein
MSCSEHKVSWDFGDGQQDTGNHVTHTFTLPGIYEVTMTVANPGQAIVSRTTTVVANGRRRATAR